MLGMNPETPATAATERQPKTSSKGGKITISAESGGRYSTEEARLLLP